MLLSVIVVGKSNRMMHTASASNYYNSSVNWAAGCVKMWTLAFISKDVSLDEIKISLSIVNQPLYRASYGEMEV